MNAKILFNKVTLKIAEKSPVILLTIGVVGVVAGTIMAVKATKNTKDIDDELKEDLETLELKKQEALEDMNSTMDLEEPAENLISIKDDNYEEYQTSLATKDFKEFTLEDYNSLRNKIVFNATKKYVILYSKAAVIEATSIICIIAGFRIIAKRYAAMAMAYTALDNSYREYRKRVQNELGKDKEEELYYGYKKELKKIKDEQNNIKEVPQLHVDGQILSPYAVFFDETSTEWSKDPGYNETFLKQLEKGMQRRFEGQGYLFLNDVKDKLGLPRTPEGQIVGWKLNGPYSDNKISFNLYNEYNREMSKKGSNVWLLDFNVDGNIYDKI
ncbi:MAG: hypothetical protein IJ094_13115 [Bacilli bacterium]|nr:hypothetical protein [Bacilli bacterium]